MAFQISTNYKLAVNPETVWGTPVTTGAKYLRMVSANLNPEQEYSESEEINADHRETTDTSAVSKKGGGQLEGEMSYNVYEALMSAALGAAPTGTATRVFKVGKALRSLTLQEEFAGLGSDGFRIYPGAIVTGMSLSMAIGQKIKTGFTFSSKMPTIASASAIGTIGAAATGSVMNPLASIQTLTDGGSPIVGCTGFSLQITNDLIEFPSLLDANPLAMFQGRFRMKGTINVYMQDAVLLNKYINQTESAVALKIGGVSSSNYLFNISKLKYVSGKNDGVRGSTAVTETFMFDALYDATNTSLMITATD